ncbi:MAG: phosphotransferase [Chloroflexi bacterium]|nr:phosphotransferase [Chloroflexota bacterium]
MSDMMPKTSEEITPDWLNEVLVDSVTGGAQVSSIKKEIIGQGAGFLGELTRLTLTYDRESPSAPASIISKLPTQDEAVRNLAQLVNVYEREVRFYEQIADETPIRTPKRYFSHADVAKGDYVLLLEDLAPGRVGDQLATCSIEQAKTALRALAGLHAKWWDSPRLGDFPWMPGTDDPALVGLISMLYQQAWPAFVERYGKQAPAEILKAGERFGKSLPALASELNTKPLTITHADYRLDNMFFDLRDGSQFAVIDWQLTQRGPALGDVTYFLTGNLTTEVRREHQDELVRVYYEALLERGVEGYEYETCWEDYRGGALFLFIFLVTSQESLNIEDYNERAQELFQTMFERYSAAILDLNAAEFLPE